MVRSRATANQEICCPPVYYSYSGWFFEEDIRQSEKQKFVRCKVQITSGADSTRNAYRGKVHAYDQKLKAAISHRDKRYL